MSYIFLDVWSKPKGPPLQGHNAIKHSEMKCLIGGDKRRRGGREGSNRGCSQASKMKAPAAPCWGEGDGWAEGKKCTRAILGIGLESVTA